MARALPQGGLRVGLGHSHQQRRLRITDVTRAAEAKVHVASEWLGFLQRPHELFPGLARAVHATVVGDEAYALMRSKAINVAIIITMCLSQALDDLERPAPHQLRDRRRAKTE